MISFPNTEIESPTASHPLELKLFVSIDSVNCNCEAMNRSKVVET